jgi:hypothetical protein
MFKRFRFSFIVAASLLFAGLACNYSNRLAQAPIQTTPPLVTPQNLENLQPQSTQSLQPLQESLTTSTPESQGNIPVKVVMDEEQLTAIVVKELQTQQDQPIEDPQILLRDGEVQVLGNVKQGALTLPLKISISVSVNDQGRPQYRVDTANVGPLPLPQSTLDQLSTQLDAALNENLGSEINNVYIENITIADGLMTVTGHQRQP